MLSHERTSSRAAGLALPLSLFAALVVASATLSPRAAAQEETAPPPPSQDSLDSARAYAAPSSVWNGQRVHRVLQDGTRIMLTDGTIWEVYLPNRPAVNTWRPGDLLIVREAAVSQGEYDYVMKDGRTRRLVWVRLVGDVNGRG
jgi:hypothetical protein